LFCSRKLVREEDLANLSLKGLLELVVLRVLTAGAVGAWAPIRLTFGEEEEAED
jgi:hypothetical protein